MTTICQPRPSIALVVAGTAGSGKSTLGSALARSLRAPLLDLDSLTNPLLDGLHEVLDEHWLSGPHGARIRDGRYAALRRTAADVLDSAGLAVLVAPFTAELHGGDEWARLLAELAPARVQMIHLDGDPELFAARRALRDEQRDAHRPPGPEESVIGVPAIRVDAELATEQQLVSVLAELGASVLPELRASAAADAGASQPCRTRVSAD